MVHECPECGKAYYCTHKNCGWVLSLQCGDCQMKETNKFIKDNLDKANQKSQVERETK
jgi:hypothetical protein